jgi:hypothetical protein
MVNKKKRVLEVPRLSRGNKTHKKKVSVKDKKPLRFKPLVKNKPLRFKPLVKNKPLRFKPLVKNKPLRFKLPDLSGFREKLSKVSRYVTFFVLLCFFVLVVYILIQKPDMITSSWVYGALGLAAGFLILLNVYFVKKHSGSIKNFFLKFKRPEKKNVVGAVVDDTKKPVKGLPKAKFRPKVLIFVAFFVLAVVAILVLNSKNVISFSDPYVLLTLGALFLASLVYVAFRFYRAHRVKSEVQQQLSKENISVIKKSIVAKSSKYKTDLDRLYELVNEKGKISLSDVVKGFNISIEMAEQWAKILEGHGMITLNYPPFGEVELCKK